LKAVGKAGRGRADSDRPQRGGEVGGPQQLEAPQRVIGFSQITIEEAIYIYVVTTGPALRIIVDGARGRTAKIHKSVGSKLRPASEEGTCYPRSLQAKRRIGEIGAINGKIATDLRSYQTHFASRNNSTEINLASDPRVVSSKSLRAIASESRLRTINSKPDLGPRQVHLTFCYEPISKKYSTANTRSIQVQGCTRGVYNTSAIALY